LKTIWLVCGPTASGKTAMAIALARHFNAEILSADSRQLFKELRIGVARPEPEELSLVKHHFIASISIKEAYSAGQFGREAREFAHFYFKDHEHLVVCGGTGLYIKAFLEGIDRSPANEQVRMELDSRLQLEGLRSLAEEFGKRNPELAAKTDLNNPRRVIRALEWLLSGSQEQDPDFLHPDWNIVKLAPEMSREFLYERINLRVEKMIQAGLWEEAESLFPLRHLNALQTVGYKEIFDCLEGKCSREEAIEKIKQHSRNYAKRQLTWFRKDPEIKWINNLDLNALSQYAKAS
jgi:tRNA dimethylallyltransferase